MKKIILTIFTLILLLTPTFVNAASYDFHIESNMEIKYEKGNRHATVKVEYIREVVNSVYYFPSSGDKTFPIPDLSSQSENQIEAERKFKKDSIKVKDSSGKDVNFSIKEEENGLSVVVPNYKQTTKSSPYKIYLTYNTHDYIQVVNQNVVIQAPSLPKDTLFEMSDESSNTLTKVDYGLAIVVDKEISPLSKIWPSNYEFEETEEFNRYSFPATSRIEKNPYVELGTSQIYKFELEYVTPKTDSLLPEKYSEVLKSLSTNIFELSLPRYFDETDQVVKISNISPTPTKIGRDSEGNIIATFEVEANKESTISVEGYVWVEQDAYDSKRDIPSPSLDEYRETISADEKLEKYLVTTKYWQVNDPYIQEEAQSIIQADMTLMDVIEADYQYINERLEYDQSKADSLNDRIGAKQALQGDAAVCMEYADAMISILRAQGIAARAAIGYANLKEASETPDTQVRHQWVQVWVPNYGWLSMDPTWESENMDIGPNIHKLLWETFNGDDLSNTRIYSADSLESVNDIQFNISVYAVKERDIENQEELKTYEEILPVQEISEESNFSDWLNKFVKASAVGRSLAVVIPIFLVLIALIVIISIIRAFITSLKNRKKETN